MSPRSVLHYHQHAASAKRRQLRQLCTLRILDMTVWVQTYTTLRKEASVSHGMPVAVRHLEAIIRMSEAHAAMHLRECVSEDDIDLAIRCTCMICSHISQSAGPGQHLNTARTQQAEDSLCISGCVC